jgi:hypothetical protein
MRYRATKSIQALIGVLLLVALLGATPAVAAQAGGSKQVLSGQTVTWTADWAPDPAVSVADENVELLALSSGGTIVGYGGTSFPVGANQVRDLLLEGFAADSETRQVDRGDYDNVSYSIDLADSDGVTLAIFTLVIENPANTSMAMLISSPDAFGTAMADAQAAITVDGAPIFAGVDGAQMQDTILAAHEAGGGATASTPAPEPTQDSGGLGDIGAAINAGTPTPAVAGAAAPANAVTLASSGAEVRYSDDWAIQTQEDANLSLGTVAQPAVLVTVIDLGPVAGSIDAAALAPGLQQQVPTLNDAEVVAALNPSPDRVVIAFRDPDTSGTLVRIYDIAIDPAATTAVTMIVGEPDLRAGIELVTTTVHVDGQPVMTDIPQLVPELFGGV